MCARLLGKHCRWQRANTVRPYAGSQVAFVKGSSMLYDFHIHSCLSPCANDDMTPTTIAGFSKLNGADAIAITDHNSALNLPAAQKACEAYGLRLLPGIETCTAEEIHLLCYFGSVDVALQMGEKLYESLPDIPYDHNIWGRQLVMDENDAAISEPQKLLTAASEMDIYQMKTLCERLGGIAVPAHVDRDNYSLLSVLGFAPQDLPFEAYEVARPEHTLSNLVANGRLPAGQQIITGSDAHNLEALPQHLRTLPEDSCLWKLLRERL